MTTQQYNTYKVAGEAHTGAYQIPALYEGCVKFMYQAKEAIQNKNYESRFNEVHRVSSIIAGLRECLDFDKSPDVARVLDDYYGMIDFQLLTLQSNDDEALCDQIISSLKQMHQAWKDVASEHNKTSDVSKDADLTLSSDAKQSLFDENHSNQVPNDEVLGALTKASAVMLSSHEQGETEVDEQIPSVASPTNAYYSSYTAQSSMQMQSTSSDTHYTSNAADAVDRGHDYNAGYLEV